MAGLLHVEQEEHWDSSEGEYCQPNEGQDVRHYDELSKKKVQHMRSEKCNIEAQWDKSDYIHNSVQKSLEQRTLH